MSSLGVLRELVDSLDVTRDVSPCADDLIELFTVIDRLAALGTSMAARFEADGGHQVSGSLTLRSWLALHTPLGRDAGRVAATAHKLRSLPHTMDAWLDGLLTGGQVSSITEYVRGEHVAMFAEHEAELVPVLAGLSPRSTARAMSKWRANADDVLGREPKPERLGLRLRRVDADGVWNLEGVLPDDVGQLLYDCLQLVDRPPLAGEATSKVQRNIEVLREILSFFKGHCDTSKMPRNHFGLLLVGYLERMGDEHCGGETIAGHHLSTRLFEEWTCCAEVTRILWDGKSSPVDIGRTSKIVTPQQLKALAVRDKGCRYPGCDRPVAWCQAHHVKHWRRDGKTALYNLVLVCSRHHHLIHMPGWSIELLDDATVVVTMPNGQQLISHPPP